VTIVAESPNHPGGIVRRLLASAIMTVLLFVPPAWSDCKSDCQNEYQSDVESCKAQLDDPDDAQELQICMDDAKSEYELCFGECEN